MKKHPFFLSALLGMTSFFAAAAATQEVPPMTFQQLREATVSQAREKALKTGKLTYQVCDEQGKALTTMTVWLEKPSKVRINIAKADDSFAVGWDGQEAPWGCDRENGVFPLSAEGKKIFFQDICYFPVINPLKDSNFSLVPDGTAEYEGIECNVYRMEETPELSAKIRFYVAEKTSLVCQVVMEEDGVPTNFSLRGYREIDGVKLPSRITVVSPEGSRIFRLSSARFDLPIPSNVFARPEGINQCNFGPGEALPAVSRSRISARPADIEKQQRLVTDLETKLKLEREKMAKMEQLYAFNQDSAVKLLSTGGVRYRSWRYYSRGYCYGYNSNRSTARKLEKQNRKLGKEYQRVLQNVTNLELKLAEAKEKLAQMTAN